MVSRMRVLTMPRSVVCAEKVMDSIIETYFAPNRTIADLREIVKGGQGVDPLKDFSEAAQEELRAFAPKRGSAAQVSGFPSRLVEVRAQARHSAGEFADVDADERALFCPGQLLLTALHAADSPACPGAGSYAKRAWSLSSSRRTCCSVGTGRPRGPSSSQASCRR
jgi:hypothetical protein